MWAAHAEGSAEILSVVSAVLRPCLLHPSRYILTSTDRRESLVSFMSENIQLTSVTASLVFDGVSDLSLLRMWVHVLQTIQASSRLRVFEPTGCRGNVGGRGGVDGQALLPACKSAKLLPRGAEWQLMRGQVLTGVEVWAGLAVPAQRALSGGKLIGG